MNERNFLWKLLLISKVVSISESKFVNIFPDYLLRLLVVPFSIWIEMINLFSVLAPLIKNFIEVVIIIGPLSIMGLIFLLKKIEKNNPDRIRWK